jgi:hypothetical protein
MTQFVGLLLDWENKHESLFVLLFVGGGGGGTHALTAESFCALHFRCCPMGEKMKHENEK